MLLASTSTPNVDELFFKCYIYCTRDKHLAFMQNQTGTNLIACMDAETAIPVGGFMGNGKIIGEFMCKGFIPFSNGRPCFVAGTPEEIERMACLTRKEIWEYAPQGNPIGWRITDLVIYDAPRELSKLTGLRTEENGFELRTLERPPQSWCYVEERHDL